LFSSYLSSGFADTGNKENQCVDFNPWNVVMFLSNCFAENDKRESPITTHERDLGLELFRKLLHTFLIW